MPKFFFDGFTTGSAVAISTVQGAFNRSGSVSTWGQTTLADVDILQITPGALIAPVGIWFEASNPQGFNVSEPGNSQDFDPTAHDITWIWEFDDPGTFTAPLNIPTAWNNKGVDYGKKAYHVFDTPGTYNVRLWGVDRNGTVGERIVPIDILDPDDVYTGPRTICVSNQGDFTGAPSGANLVGSIGAAQSAAQILGQTCRILLRRGEVFQETFVYDDARMGGQFGAFGTGAKPIMRPPVSSAEFGTSCIVMGNGNIAADTVFHDIRFEGDWDAATETGDRRGGSISYATHNGVAFNTLIFRCELDGLGALYLNGPINSTLAQTWGVVDCDITNWGDYGLFAGAGVVSYDPEKRLAIVGTAIHQKIDACRGGQGKNGLGNDHGPFRSSDIMQTVISASDFYSANSWVVGVQPCARFAQADANNPGGFFINVNRLVCEGGTGILGVDGQNRGAPELPGNHIFDKFLLVWTYETSESGGSAYGGTTFRNGLIIRPDMNYKVGPLRMLNFITDDPQNGNHTARMDIYNNTFLNLAATPVANLFQNLTDFVNYTEENNITFEPAAGNTAAGPIDLSTTINGFTPRNTGERASVEKVEATMGTVTNGGSTTVPYPAGTSSSDFSQGGRHTVQINGTAHYYSHRGQCSLSFGGATITVTNTSGETWEAGSIRLGLDQETLITNSAYASPATVPLPLPQAGSNAMINDGGFLAYDRFDTSLRLQAPWKGSE